MILKKHIRISENEAAFLSCVEAQVYTSRLPLADILFLKYRLTQN